MTFPLQITAHDVHLSESMDNELRDRATKLVQYCYRIVRCRVMVEAPVRNHHSGRPFQVRLSVTVPGTELVVNHHVDTDFYVAARHAFTAMGRQLEDYTRQRRGSVKTHEPPLVTGRFTKLVPSKDYGFLVTTDGRDIYFHRNSVLAPGFDHVTVGTEVRFVEEQGNEGPQASMVYSAHTYNAG
jgi:cold shock CspA family protein/ribosome-associated translation inhibitor RaiA